MSIARYPLQWPVGWKRTEGWKRQDGRFNQKQTKLSGSVSRKKTVDLTITAAMQRVADEMSTMGIKSDDWLISSNLETRLDGLPRSNQRRPSDPGIAVYWRIGKTDRVMAIDLYNSPEANLAAIAATLSALRAIERHGGAAILDRAFAGFDALPAPDAKRAWWEVLDVMAHTPTDVVKAAYRRMAMDHHPDRGGSEKDMAEINQAWAEFCKERGL